MTNAIAVQERERTITFTFDDVMRYHGVHSPGGVAVAFKAMERAFALLCPDQPPPRRELFVRTAFRGPGARDCFEAVTRAVSDDRYTVDRSLVRGDRGVTVLLRDGFVTGEFIDLARTDYRTESQEQRLDELKANLAERVIGSQAAEVFDVE